MALPELPDDRRAQPRRFVPADQPAPPRHAEGEQAARVNGHRTAPPAGRNPQQGPVPPEESSGGRRRRAEPEADERRRPGAPVRQAPRRAPDGANGRGSAEGRPPASPEQRPANGRRPDDRRSNGRAQPNADLLRPPEQRRPSEPAGREQLGPPEAAQGRRRAPEQRPDARAAGVPQAFGAEPGPATKPPRRRGEPIVDEPTALVGVGDESDANPEFPGKHRRRAGESADERPAAAYRELVASDGRKPRTGRRRRTSFWKELPVLVVVALLLTFLIQTFVAKVYVIPSGSMETTLHGCTGCTNDRVLVDKITYRFSDPQPGDVVVFRGPDSWNSEIQVDPPSNVVVAGLQQLGSLIGLAPPDEKDFVKRVIAVGGQTVQCCSASGAVMVDGKPLTEPYIYYLPEAGPPKQENFGPVTVPQGSLWMMGDSRNNSADSRVPGHGAVPVDDVIGKARVIVLPFSRFGWIQAYDPQATVVGLGTNTPADQGALALGIIGVLPLAWRRRRRDAADVTVAGVGTDIDGFLPR